MRSAVFSLCLTVLVSYYGIAHQGHLTASGERYDRWAHTCASRTLPLGSWVRIRHHGGRWVYARVTDRGPFVAGRDLDVSEVVAFELGIRELGIGRCEMEVLG